MNCPNCGFVLKDYPGKWNFHCSNCNLEIKRDFMAFEHDSIFVLENEPIGPIFVSINFAEKTVMFHTSHKNLYQKKEPFSFGPVSVNDVGVSFSGNELFFSFKDLTYPGYIAKCQNRDEAYHIYRVFSVLKTI